jgi:hypothetical protein
VSLWEWPALRGVDPREESRFNCRRGIYGKVDNAGTDFRWIAASDGFTRSKNELHKVFNPGSQGVPRIPLWWRFEGRYYAASGYISAGRDHAGREYLETQILEWDGDAPIALAALALLSGAAASSPVEWSAWKDDPNWADDGYVRTISSCQVKFAGTALEEAAERGLQDLRVFGERALREFYRALLSRRTPAFLTGLEKPLSPAALAALLLPFRKDECGAFSLAGWETEEIAHWSGMACSEARSVPVDAGRRFAPADEDRAAMMAKAVLANKPQLAGKPCDAVRAILAFARDPRKRWAEATELPKTESSIDSAEEDLLEMSLLELVSAPLPKHLQDAPPEVRDAYRRHMESKAEVMKAWWLVAVQPADINGWIAKHPSTGAVTLQKVLSTWPDNSLSVKRLRQLGEGAGATSSSTP